MIAGIGLRLPRLLSAQSVWYFYRRRLQTHGVQELLAGLGVAVAVALVFAVTVTNSSVTGSARNVVRAVTGPAQLQVHARSPDGFDERLLQRIEHLPGVAQAAPLLEQTATVISHHRRVTVAVAGTDVSLAILNGLAHTLPIGALAPGSLGLSATSARQLGLPTKLQGTLPQAELLLRGRRYLVSVSAVLGREAAGALAQADVAVMPLQRLQRLAHLPGQITRVLVRVRATQLSRVRRALAGLVGGRLAVTSATDDVSLLSQALRPSNQASALFAGLSALLGFLFAFNAMLLTVPERREAIADLRLDGMSRSAVSQMVVFQATCLGLVASAFGLVAGALLSGVFRQSPGYLARAFTLGSNTVVGPVPIALAVGGGVLASVFASAILLLDLRKGRPLDAALSDRRREEPGAGVARRGVMGVALWLLLLATALFVFVPALALVACILLALATVLAVPLVLSAVLSGAGWIVRTNERLTALPLALSAMRVTAVRTLALAATGAVALFGSVALGSARSDLLRGIDGYTSHYTHGARLWVVNPDDNQAINDFQPDGYAARIAAIPGVVHAMTFQGSFLDFGRRRIWVIGWPPRTPPTLLQDQVLKGSAKQAAARLRQGGWVVVSDQVAAEHHAHVGNTIMLPTPSGRLPFRIAATTTNFGWTPGALLMSTTDYSRAWSSAVPSAIGVTLADHAQPDAVARQIRRALGPASGLEVLSASQRETAIEKSAREGLGQLGDIATLLLVAAILSMSAALVSSIWQRRPSLAELRLEGASTARVQLILLLESALMLSAGCLAGAAAGVYGQVIIDGYLKHVTGFPVASAASGGRPVEIFFFVIAAVLAVVSIPSWLASHVPPRLALEEERIGSY